MSEQKNSLGTVLRSHIESEEILVTPGAFDAFSAKLIELTNFKAAFLSGYGMSASLLGQTDASFTSLTDVSSVARNASRILQIPVVVDADTGFGNAVNTAWTIRTISESGAAGATIEDQIFPKACAVEHTLPVINKNEMIGKIKAAVDHRQNSDFVICARTDAFVAEGIQGVINRGNAYREAGADAIFVSTPASLELTTIETIVKAIDAPVHMVLPEGTKDAVLTIEQLHEAGVAWTTIPLTPLLAAADAMYKTLQSLRNSHSVAPADLQGVMPFQEFQSIVGSERVRQMEQQYGEGS